MEFTDPIHQIDHYPYVVLFVTSEMGFKGKKDPHAWYSIAVILRFNSECDTC